MYGYFSAFDGWLNLNGRGDDIFTIKGEEVPMWNIANFLNSPSTGNDPYGALYSGIQRANIVLRYIDQIPASGITEEDRSMIKGEALFLRGYQYFLLVNNYKEVPLRLIPSNEDETNKGPASEAALWTQVEEDLGNAIKCNLPVERTTAKERVTKGAAIAMLGKVYATQHKYPEAKQLLVSLLSAPYSYELVDDFAKNFTNEEEFNKESVYEIAYSPDGEYSWSNESGICLGCYIPQFIGPVKSGGWAKLMPNSFIVGEFTKETRPNGADTNFDKRIYASLFFDPANYGDKVANEKWYGNNYSMDELWEGNEGKMAGGAPSFNVNGTPGKFLIKKNTAYYVDDKAPDNMGNKEGRSSNLRVMRFAEVLLLYAEACAKTNDADGANYALKLIRKRAGLQEKTFTQDELMTEIEHQCLLEFFGEGHRFYDLKRWYSVSEIQLIFKANGKQGAENFQEKHLYYPIPTSELNNNTAMEQTSLWK
jgi:SusD family.